MDTADATRSSLGDGRFILDTSAKPLSYFLTTILVILFVYSMQGPKFNVPSINDRKAFEFTNSRPKKIFLANARDLLKQWFSANPNKPTRLIGDMGETIVLPPYMADEIRNDNRLSFTDFAKHFFQVDRLGLDAFAEGNKDSITLVVINKDLTKSLAKVTEPLADETSLALRETFTENKEWHAIPLRSNILHLIARISSRVFLGTEVCRNEAWLNITKGYTLNGFATADRLREYNPVLRGIVQYFLPGCRKGLEQIKEAYSIIQPIIDSRRTLKAKATAEGKPIPVWNDAIEWFEQAAKGTPYRPVIAQLFLSTVAIHTTTDLLTQVLVDLAQHPEIIEELRTEVIGVLKEGGWKKTSLTNMRLLDSVIKESQRLKPLQLASMQRLARADVTLSDGTFIPKGSNVCVSSTSLWDPEIYPEPERWDGYRFLRMREQDGKTNMSQLVSTSSEHLGFGHGKHACPGRFFAANEIKIALVHILLQYEWRLPTGVEPKIIEYGIAPAMDPTVELEICRREEEIDLSLRE
ncbi:Dihydromonacolin L monooxygenase LovA 6 [Colletotrichum chlorophyti]|uniref:Dihydromonacolin L monooxygenase LovA 6 n=1 Tax=Colletotrichum chlorophyti TaxID=708187 RepID=A0A1Q8RG80_9PEZI|nr:Dihydromonacolin L monooxygenase LovA 6 [Colletotrichum chlorophyti]